MAYCLYEHPYFQLSIRQAICVRVSAQIFNDFNDFYDSFKTLIIHMGAY